jgi:hypothetical protein
VVIEQEDEETGESQLAFGAKYCCEAFEQEIAALVDWATLLGDEWVPHCLLAVHHPCSSAQSPYYRKAMSYLPDDTEFPAHARQHIRGVLGS